MPTTRDRHDYAFPFRIDPESRQARRSPYEAHVAQLVRQLLLTTPGERADLPAFGCGLRALVFAGNTASLAAATQMLVQQALATWLSDHLIVRTVDVSAEDAEVLISIEYTLLATQRVQRVEVRVR